MHNNEMLLDIINLLEQNINETDIVHIDNLLSEIAEHHYNFNYSLTDISILINSIFKSDYITAFLEVHNTKL